MRHTYEPWQIEADAYMPTKEHPALFMEMRLGKNLVTMRDIQRESAKGARKVLWTTSFSSFKDWKDDADREGLFWRDYPSMGRTNRRTNFVELFNSSRFEIALVNHDMLRAEPLLTELPWDYVVIDESVKLKNPLAALTKLVVPSFRQVKRRVILSGRPAPEDELEYFCQFQFLHGRFMGCSSYWNFRSTYFEPDPFSYQAKKWRPLPGVKTKISEAVRAKAFVKLRSEIRSDEKHHAIRVAPINSEQVRLQKMIAKDWVWSANGRSDVTDYAPVKEGWLRRIAGGFTPDGLTLISDTKLKLLESIIWHEFPHQPVVVWCMYKAEVEAVKSYLQAHARPGTVVRSMTGDNSPVEIEALNEAFRAGRVTILVATIAVAATGANLSAADVAIYYSNEWSNNLRGQSEDRIVSMQKMQPVLILDLVTDTSVDEEAVVSLRDKNVSSTMIMSGWYSRMVA